MGWLSTGSRDWLIVGEEVYSLRSMTYTRSDTLPICDWHWCEVGLGSPQRGRSMSMLQLIRVWLEVLLEDFLSLQRNHTVNSAITKSKGPLVYFDISEYFFLSDFVLKVHSILRKQLMPSIINICKTNNYNLLFACKIYATIKYILCNEKFYKYGKLCDIKK